MKTLKLVLLTWMVGCSVALAQNAPATAHPAAGDAHPAAIGDSHPAQGEPHPAKADPHPAASTEIHPAFPDNTSATNSSFGDVTSPQSVTTTNLNATTAPATENFSVPTFVDTTPPVQAVTSPSSASSPSTTQSTTTKP